MKCTLIISTYNRPDALKMCLESITRQVQMPDEIVIADDGSDSRTRELIIDYRKKISCPIKHVWQEDEGYRLAQIRNKAFAVSTGEYIIQTDGDLLFHAGFIQDHIKFARKKCFVSGARANMNEAVTSAILASQMLPELRFYSTGVSKKYNAVRNTLLRNIHAQLQTSPENVKYVLGCNMAFWKEDVVTVNGYNEDFSGWGKEDNDIAIRLMNAGIKLRFLKYGAIVFHLWHPEAKRNNLAVNEKLFDHSVAQKTAYVKKGLDQYL